MVIICLAMALMSGYCGKETPVHTKTVRVHIFEGGATVKFIGQNNQVTFMFTEDIDVLKLPAYGTYWICATFDGGCGGLRVTKAVPNGEENVLLVMPSGGEACVTGQRLASEYYASVNCE